MWEDRELENLVEVVVSLDTTEEARAFLRDLMTEAELKEFARRWKAARMLYRKVPYTTIEKETGLSSATIARVSKWLQEGEGGYRSVLERFSSQADVPGVAAVSDASNDSVPIG
jgi:TrpR-related protein YerC/YecD